MPFLHDCQFYIQSSDDYRHWLLSDYLIVLLFSSDNLNVPIPSSADTVNMPGIDLVIWA